MLRKNTSSLLVDHLPPREQGLLRSYTIREDLRHMQGSAKLESTTCRGAPAVELFVGACALGTNEELVGRAVALVLVASVVADAAGETPVALI